MQDSLLRWYNTELGFLRRMGEEFAQEHPKIAGRLKLGPESSQDPHVERLIEAVAFLNARMQQKIDDDFPELSNAILQVLQPQFLAPIPSMMIAQFGLDEGEAESTTGYDIKRGTELETETIDGEPCRFRIGYPVSLWPITIESAACESRPFNAPQTPHSTDAMAVVHLVMKTQSPETSFSDFSWKSLRFFLNGQPQTTYSLYEALFSDCVDVLLARSPDDHSPIHLGVDALQPVGFSEEELLVPGTQRSAWQYRLITEFFAFPQKFLFFDLAGMDSLNDAGYDDELHLFAYLKKSSRELENGVVPNTFQLGCAPAVNLFSQRADPIYLSQTDYEYPVLGDVRRPDAVEIFSVDAVYAQSNAGDEVKFRPFYSVDHSNTGEDDHQFFWQAYRRDAKFCETDATTGSEIYMSFVDLSHLTVLSNDWIVNVETTCLNRDLPGRLPFGGGQPRLFLSDESGAVQSVTAMTPLTPTIRPKLMDNARWRLISHLGIDHQAIVGGDDAAELLREILSIYDFEESSASRTLIRSILDVRSRRVTRRVRDAGFVGVCRGVETTIELDRQIQEPRVFLLACVLEQFLGRTCTINSFSQLTVQFDKDSLHWKTWPPRTGDRTLL